MTTSGINRHGFTLLEIILVATLIAISVAIGAPYFAQSIRGNRLQVGARTLTMAARYARSMAVMRQQSFQLSGTVGGNTIRIQAVGSTPRPSADDSLNGLGAFDAEAATLTTSSSALPPADLSRTLDGVIIQEFRIQGGDWQSEGSFSVTFFPNGTCVGFEILLQESGGRRIRVHVDELGAIRAEMEP